MASLSSSSSFAQVQQCYFDNAGYMEDGSPTKAAAFITACRFLLLMIPTRSEKRSGGLVQFDMKMIQSEMQAAQRWLSNANAAEEGAGVVYPSFDGLRGFSDGAPTPESGNL